MTSAVDDFLNQSTFVAKSATIGAMDDDPDEAGQALDLESETGVPATAIYGDLDGFNRQYKSHLASNIISDNQIVANWLSSHPMAPRVAHDDLAALDDTSRAIDPLHQDTGLWNWLKTTAQHSAKAMMTPPEAFTKGFGEAPIGTSILQRPSDMDWALSHPAAAAVGMTLATPMELMSRTIGGLMSMGHENIASVFGESIANEAQAMAEWAMMRGDVHVGGTGVDLFTHNPKLAETLSTSARALDLMDPWLRLDREPPPGIHPLIDEAKKLQVSNDIKTLDDALAEASKSATRERAPDLFAEFIRAHVGDREIGVAPEAVRELYGDKIPNGDDNLLGWVPDLDKRLASAELSGDDVRIPLADWLARVNPDVAKQLHDDIRVRDSGMTVNESKVKAEPVEVGPDQVQQIRGMAGMEPLAAVGDRKVQLKLQPEKEAASYTTGAKFHDIDMLDENGNSIGTINISEQKDGKQLYIEMIQAGDKEHKFYQPNFLGPALIRDVGRQLKQMFPKAFDKANGGEGITGHRVSGAREAAGTWEAKHAMPKVLFDFGEDPQAFRDLLQPHWEPISNAVEVLRGDFGEKARPIAEAIEGELQRLVPNVSREVVHSIYYPRAGGEAHGLYQPDFGKIFVALSEEHGIGTARHEAIHALKRLDFIRPDEWQDLLAESRAQGWRERFGIDKRYPSFSDDVKDEEAIAEAYRYWRKGEDIVKDPGVFERIKDFIETLHRRIKEILGRDFTWEEIFKDIDSGRVGRRQIDEHGMEEAQPELGAIDEPTGSESSFGIYDRAKALGVTQSHMDRMLDLIQKRNAEDLAASQRRAEVRQRRRSNKEWKDRRIAIQDDVRQSLRERPDIAIDQLFAKQKIKFDPAYLSEDQKLRLPKDYIQKKDGVNPDDLAPYFGYTSGDALVERLGMYAEDRKRSGLSPRDYFNRLVDVETDRRLNSEFGDREQNILDEAKDQALSETQLNLVHEETLAYALKAGAEPQFTKEQVSAMVRQVFNETPVGQISSDRLLQTAGKLGKKIEEATTKGDWAGAYRLSQQRNHATIAAKFACEYERARAQFDRTAKQFRKREVASVPAEYINWVHDILQRVGQPINRSIQDLQENIGRQGETTLADFVSAKETEWMGMRELPIADFLLDPNFRGKVDDLSAHDFMGMKMSVDVLIKAGRDEKKILREGESWDREQAVSEMREKLASFGYKPSKAEPGKLGKWPKAFFYGLTNMETLLNRWDRGDPRGIFNRLVMSPLADAANYKAKLQRDVAAQYKALSQPKDLDKLIDSPITDPLTRSTTAPEGTGTWLNFRKSNVLAMLQNAGNKSNWNVLARGYGEDPATLFAWLQKNVTLEDIQRAEGLGKIFKGLVDKADGVYERMTGASIEKVPLEPIEFTLADGTKYQSKGWYHPLIADSERKTVWVQDPETGQWGQKAEGKKEKIDDMDFFHFTTSNGYTKKRTGVIYPLDLNFSMTPTRIKQMIHDIAFREVIHETQKVFADRRFSEDVSKYYGTDYSKGLMPYLRSVAGAEGINSEGIAKANSLSEYLRQNVISTYIGFNPFTVLKHGPTAAVMSSKEVGLANFARAIKTLYAQAPSVAKITHDFIKDNSQEIGRRERHWQDTIAGQGREITGAGNLREKIIEKGSAAVAWSDMVSAKPTWLAAYESAQRDGLDHGESVSMAERAVRRAHGSTAETNQPPLVRGGGPLHSWLTSVYGFFGTAMQRRIETAHKLNDAWELGKDGEINKASRKLGSAFADFMTYMVWPTIVEEAVTGIGTDDHRTWGSRLISGATMGMASSVLYLRDLIHGAVSGHEPGVGLLSSALHDVNEAIRDVSRGRDALNRQHAAKTVGDLLTVTGEATGMVPKPVANAIKYGINVREGQERPRSIADVLLGATKGTQKRKVEK